MKELVLCPTDTLNPRTWSFHPLLYNNSNLNYGHQESISHMRLNLFFFWLDNLFRGWKIRGRYVSAAGVLLHILLSGTLPFLGTKDRLYECICEGKLYLATSRWQYISDHAKVQTCPRSLFMARYINTENYGACQD